MQNSKYSRLNPGQYRNQDDFSYTGVWRGETVTFSRMFRGHLFTNEECEALCAGHLIEVHNIQGRHGVYAVQGQLLKVDRGFLSTVKFDVLDIVPNNPNHVFGMPLYDLHPSSSGVDEVVDLNDDDLSGICFGNIADVMRDAELYREHREMAESAALAALDDTDDAYGDSEYLNIADENPYGDFEEHELFEMQNSGNTVDTSDDFCDEDYDDLDDDDVMLDVLDEG